MNNTFILLSRSILDSEVFASESVLKVWIWCLCRANHKSSYVSITGFDSVKIDRGQFVFGRKKAAVDLKMNESLVYRAVKRLEKLGNVNIKSNNKYSVVTIVNYDKYQNSESYLNNKRTTTEQQLNNKRTTTEQQLNTDNNEKKNKNVNNEKKIENRDLIFPFNSTQFIEAWNIWKEYKSVEHKFKYKSVISEQAALKKLSEISRGSEQIALKIINNSMANGYKGLFELKKVKQDETQNAINSIAEKLRRRILDENKF